VGNNAWIESFVAISAGREGRIEIGSTCELRSFARLEANEGHITLGDSCSVNPFCLLDGFGGLTIGNDVRIASNSVLLSSSHCYDDVDVSIHSQGAERRPTVIEDDVWIGAHVVVTGGVRIGAHSIIGAGAIVLKDIPPYSVAAGVPARVVRSRTG
jgi:acetyltransferase-like isoleucine patch superfamily enzyme